MRLGMFIGAAGAPWDVRGQVEEVVKAERDGFESFWFTGGGAEPLTVIAMAGSRTERIEIGTAVVPIFTRHPNLMAQEAVTVNNAAGGRFVLGLGLAHRGTIERLGLSFEQPVKRIREYLSVLRPLLADGKVSFKGDIYQVEAALRTPWAQPCPVFLAALGPVMLKLAGEMADGTLTWMVGRETLARHTTPRITAAARAAGRPPPRIAVGVPVAVCDDMAAARERAHRIYQGYAAQPSYRRMLDIEGGGPEAVVVCGPEAEVERQIRGFAAAGATDFLASIYPVGDDVAGSVARTRTFLQSLVGHL